MLTQVISETEQDSERMRYTTEPSCLLSRSLCSTGSKGKLEDERKTSPSFSQTLLYYFLALSPPPSSPHTPTYTPNIFNYIFYQVVRLSNQGVDIDACADKSTNTGNKINKDFEERVTANFAQWLVPHSRLMFLIEQATPENSCFIQGRGTAISQDLNSIFTFLFSIFVCFVFISLIVCFYPSLLIVLAQPKLRTYSKFQLS